MEKDSFLKLFKEEEEETLYKVFNSITLSRINKTPICTKEFLTPNIWMKVLEHKDKLDINVLDYGIFEESQRRVLIFNTKEPLGVSLIMINNKSKFNSLNHKDYMGGVLALGIKREKLGDFIVKGNSCLVPCVEDIKEFLISNIETIGNTKVFVEEVKDVLLYRKGIEFEDIVIDIPSLRLDSIVSEITKQSRNDSIKFLNKGLVLINYVKIIDKSKKVDLGSVITIRGYGKYKIVEEIGTTKKGNKRIYIKKYK